MAKKSGRTLKKITKLLERYVTQHGHLMEWIEKGAQRALTAAGERADAGRSAADVQQRLDEMEARSAERHRADEQFRAELLIELRRHNELVAAALAHALPAHPAAKPPEAAKPLPTVKPLEDARPTAPKKSRPGAKPAAR